MIFQDPLSSLDPRQSVESLLVEGLKAHGLADDKAATQRRLRETLDAVGLPASALRKYPHEFSGGQRQRIGIARALVLDPDLIVADEPVSALDVSIQAQVLNLLEDLQNERGLTYLIIAHDLAVVRHIADTVGVMYLGGLVEEASSDDLYRRADAPVHQGADVGGAGAGPAGGGPARADPARRRPALAGQPAAGCRFHTRCPWAQPTRCADERPALRERRRRTPGGLPLRRGHRAGRIRPHEVEPELVRPDDGGAPGDTGELIPTRRDARAGGAPSAGPRRR